jgi:hypothetical protein
MRWVGQVASMGEMTYQKLIGKPEENRLLDDTGGSREGMRHNIGFSCGYF